MGGPLLEGVLPHLFLLEGKPLEVMRWWTLSQHIVEHSQATKRKCPVTEATNTAGLTSMQRMLAQEGRRITNSLATWLFAECGEVNEATHGEK